MQLGKVIRTIIAEPVSFEETARKPESLPTPQHVETTVATEESEHERVPVAVVND